MKHSIKDWLLVTKPWSFSASALPILASLLYLNWYGMDVNWLNGIWAVFNIIFFQAAGNLWSDYYDYKKGVDAEDTYSTTILTSGKFKGKEIVNYAWLLLIIGCLLGLVLMYRTSCYLLLFGIVGTLFVLFYPFMKFHAMGDLNIFLAYSIVSSLGLSYVATGNVNFEVWYVAIPIGILVDSILFSNNTRDIVTDKRAGITTIAHIFGIHGCVVYYDAEVILSYLLVLCFVLIAKLPIVSLIVFLSIPIAVKNIKMMNQYPSKGAISIALLDQKSASLQLIFSLLLAISLLSF